ncbi:MAG: hypothetical protein EOM51_09935 [Clostridia bacterium]|nr:hypothetical protein [Clostridia bacterium]
MIEELSPKIELTSDFEKNIEKAFNYFSDNLNNKFSRPRLFEKFVYIENHEIIDNKPAGFWHAISLEENHKFADVLPCVNDPTISDCGANCNNSQKTITIKAGTEKRNICLLRASMLPWIVDIIRLANAGNNHISYWEKEKKIYIRYLHRGIDYILIFADNNKFYRLISSYPVFYLKEKREFDSDSIMHAIKK